MVYEYIVQFAVFCVLFWFFIKMSDSLILSSKSISVVNRVDHQLCWRQGSAHRKLNRNGLL